MRADLDPEAKRRAYKHAVRARLEAAAVAEWTRAAAGFLVADNVPLVRWQGSPMEVGALFEYEGKEDGAHSWIRDWQALRMGFLRMRAAEGLDMGSCVLCGGGHAGLRHLASRCSGPDRERAAFLQALGTEGARKWSTRAEDGWLEVFSTDHDPHTLEQCIRYGGAIGRRVRQEA